VVASMLLLPPNIFTRRLLSCFSLSNKWPSRPSWTSSGKHRRHVPRHVTQRNYVKQNFMNRAIHHTSHVTRHTAHVTRQKQNVTRHTSKTKRHKSHVTRHKSHVACDLKCTGTCTQPLAGQSQTCRQSADASHRNINRMLHIMTTTQRGLNLHRKVDSAAALVETYASITAGEKPRVVLDKESTGRVLHMRYRAQ
jgi:hypothetical protein